MDPFPLPRTSMLSLAHVTSPSITVSFSALLPLASLIDALLVTKLLVAQFTTIHALNSKCYLLVTYPLATNPQFMKSVLLSRVCTLTASNWEIVDVTWALVRTERSRAVISTASFK